MPANVTNTVDAIFYSFAKVWAYQSEAKILRRTKQVKIGWNSNSYFIGFVRTSGQGQEYMLVLSRIDVTNGRVGSDLKRINP